MKLSPRERRLVYALGAMALLAILFWPKSEVTPVVVSATDSIPKAEQRLLRIRQLAGAVPGRKEVLEKANAELANGEKALILADTAPQAQARLVEIVRRVGRAQNPPLDIRNIDFVPPKPYGDQYGEVAAGLTVSCRIEQLVNYLADLANQPEAIAVGDMVVGNTSEKQKMLNVRLSVSGLVPRKLVPERKGLLL